MGYASRPAWHLPAGADEAPADAPPLPPPEALERLADGHRLDLLRADFDRKLGRNGVRTASIGLIPQLTVGLDGGQDSDRSGFLGPFFNLTLPIFDPGLVAVASAKMTAEKDDRTYAALAGQVRQDVRTAYANLAVDQDDLRFYRDQFMPEQERTVRLAQRSFDLGEGSLNDLLDALRDYVSAQQQYADAIDRLPHRPRRPGPGRRHDRGTAGRRGVRDDPAGRHTPDLAGDAMSRTKTITIVAVAAAATAAGVAFVIIQSSRATPAPTAAAADPFKVAGDRITISADAARTAGLKVTAVERQAAPVTLDLTGRTGFDMDRVVHVHAPFAGRIVELGPELGTVVVGPTTVTAGHPTNGPATRPTPLCTIESTDLANAKNAYLKAKVSVDVDQHEVDRTQQLAKETIVAQKAVLDAQTALEKDRLDKELARQQLVVFWLDDAGIAAVEREAGRQKMTYTIAAPRGGVITEKNTTRGELADNSSNLFTIADLSDLWVWGDVYERDWAKVRVGQPVRVYAVGRADQPIDATLDWISPVIDDTTRSVRVRATVANPDRRLLADMYARLSVTADPGVGVVRGPGRRRRPRGRAGVRLRPPG